MWSTLMGPLHLFFGHKGELWELYKYDIPVLHVGGVEVARHRLSKAR